MVTRRFSRRHLLNRNFLESLYRRYTRREEIGYDPIRFILPFPDPRDQEAVGLVAATLSYGHVKQIHASMTRLQAVMTSRPADWLANTSSRDRAKALPEFRHRWTSRDDMLGLWSAIADVQARYGSLGSCFCRGVGEEDRTLEHGLNRLVQELRKAGSVDRNRVLAAPESGSACKRMLMYLRWMVRSDAVDPGPWKSVEARHLAMPLDTHILSVARRFHLTRRKAADWKTVQEVTARFRTVAPEDPVRYDFALTRTGMRGPGVLDEALREFYGEGGLSGGG